MYTGRASGVGELYTYLPLTDHNSTQQRSIPPLSVENADYGFSVGRGSFNLQKAIGNWVTVATRLKLNDIGSENGEIELWIDGNRVIFVDGLMLRESEMYSIQGMHFQTFFGGEKMFSYIYIRHLQPSVPQVRHPNGHRRRTSARGLPISLVLLSPNTVLLSNKSSF